METVLIKSVIGYPNYQVDSNGIIYSLNYMNTGTKQELKASVGATGYKVVTLSLDGKRTTKKVHRLVAESFLDRESCKDQVNHKNSNKLDNRLENLEWVTMSENIQHRENAGFGLRGNAKPKYFETTNTWRSRVKWNYKSITLGYYKTRNEAQQIIDTFFECIKYINQEKK